MLITYMILFALSLSCMYTYVSRSACPQRLYCVEVKARSHILSLCSVSSTKSKSSFSLNFLQLHRAISMSWREKFWAVLAHNLSLTTAKSQSMWQ